MPDHIVAYTEFVDGALRPVYEATIGKTVRQYVLDDDGETVFGVWYIPREECDLPIIVNITDGGAV